MTTARTAPVQALAGAEGVGATGAGAGGFDLGFEGMNQGQTRNSPPDSHIAVGPGHVVQVCNSAIGFFTRDGDRTFLQSIEGPNGFWGSVWGAIPATSTPFDPEVLWDPYDRRFIAMAITGDWINRIAYALIAVSDDDDPNGTWHKYAVDVTQPGGAQFQDQPTMAVDASTLYFAVHSLAPSNNHVVFLDKAPLLQGQPPVKNSMILAPPFLHPGVQYAVNEGAAPPVQYAVEMVAGNAALRVRAIVDPLGTPQLPSFDVAVPAFTFSTNVPSRGSPNTVRNNSLISRVWRNGSLWLTHGHSVNGRNLVRWYEIATNGWPGSGQTPTLVQTGDLDDGPDVHTFMAAISVDAQNNAVLCYARSSVNERLSMQRRHRLAGDPPGTMRPPQMIRTSSSAYTFTRWGDYCAVVQDPVDPGAMWYTHEFAAGGSWRTWIGRMHVQDWLGPDASSISASSGGTATLRFENASQAGRAYLLLGSVSGTSPGTILPWSVHVPLNLDPFTGAALSLVNSPTFANFLGVVDGRGHAVADLTLPGGLDALQGLTLHFAAVVATGPKLRDVGFASNAVSVTLTQ